MLTTATKNKINTARDILVGKIPMPTSQVEQITLALTYKFMSDMDKEARKLGDTNGFFANGYEKYAWEKLMDKAMPARDRVKLYGEGLEKMALNPHIPQLFRDIFRNAFLPFNDPETLKLFLDTIDQFEYDHSEELGNAFEYLLQIMGSQGDAGQFRTPRHIIDFVVEVVDPSKTDKILDPACGTAGFLVSAYKHLIKKGLKNDEMAKVSENFVGYDISQDMQRLSLVNMYLHHFPDPHIYEYDTLTSEDRWNDNFDVILANPPFMTPKGGIRPHNRFSTDAKRAEVLFLDYAIEHLTGNSKSGLIVPEGVLHNDYSAYKKLRLRLINDGLLYAVVELPHGVFKPYASVKTHVLFTNKQIAKRKEEIFFGKIVNDGFSQTNTRTPLSNSDVPKVLSQLSAFISNNEFTTDDLSWTVPKSEIVADKKVSLVGRRYKAISTAEESRFPTTKLSTELITIKKGKSSSTKTEPGDFPLIVTAEELRTADHYDFEGEAICIPIVSSTGHGHASVNRVHFSQGKFALADIMCAIFVNDPEKLDAKYLYHVLSVKKDEILASLMTGTSNVSLDPNDLYDLEIPYPSIEEQRTFVNKMEVIDKEREQIKKKLSKLLDNQDSDSMLFWD